MAMRIIKDFAGLLCRPDEAIRQAITGLNANPYLFQIVLDSQNKVVGTLTDGDVRRGLLGNVSLDQPISRVMNAKPVLAPYEGYEPWLPRLPELAGFLPLIDSEMRLQGVVVADRGPQAIGTALILAGGRGSRLGEHTRAVPKPLLPVANRPILEHVIEAIERVGVQRVFISVHYLADQIADFIAARKNLARIELIRENIPLGTAGSLGLLPELDDSPTFVINGDLITKVDLSAMASFHLRNDFDATIGASEHRLQLPYGVIRYQDDGTFQRIDEKPVVRNLVSGGIYLLSAACRRLVPTGVPTDMPDILNRAKQAGLHIGVFPMHEYWQGVGYPDDLDRAEQHHKEPNVTG